LPERFFRLRIVPVCTYSFLFSTLRKENAGADGHPDTKGDNVKDKDTPGREDRGNSPGKEA